MRNDNITPRRSILIISPLDAIVCLLFAKRCDHQAASSIVLAGWGGIIARWPTSATPTPKSFGSPAPVVPRKFFLKFLKANFIRNSSKGGGGNGKHVGGRA